MKNPYGFWISPNADVHTIMDDYGHQKFIEKLLGKKFQSAEDADASLLDDGWIRIVNTDQTLMVNYKCITSSKQLQVLKAVEQKLEENGVFHTQFILDYGYDYHFFDSFEAMMKRIRQRLYLE